MQSRRQIHVPALSLVSDEQRTWGLIIANWSTFPNPSRRAIVVHVSPAFDLTARTQYIFGSMLANGSGFAASRIPNRTTHTRKKTLDFKWNISMSDIAESMKLETMRTNVEVAPMLRFYSCRKRRRNSPKKKSMNAKHGNAAKPYMLFVELTAPNCYRQLFIHISGWKSDVPDSNNRKRGRFSAKRCSLWCHKDVTISAGIGFTEMEISPLNYLLLFAFEHYI